MKFLITTMFYVHLTPFVATPILQTLIWILLKYSFNHSFTYTTWHMQYQSHLRMVFLNLLVTQNERIKNIIFIYLPETFVEESIMSCVEKVSNCNKLSTALSSSFLVFCVRNLKIKIFPMSCFVKINYISIFSILNQPCALTFCVINE